MVRQTINHVGVVGAGTMGAGIAQVAATHDYAVTMYDLESAILEDGLASIEDSLERLEERDALESDSERVRDRIEATTDFEALAACDLVVEVVLESIDVKRDVFDALEETCASDVLLATNTSTLSITSIASGLDDPARVVGVHFMNPVPLMAGVEVVVGERSAPQAVELAHEFAASLEKETWEADDKPGFVTNRILLPWINEGIRAYDEGVATREDIDRGMELGTNVPMGPLRLADHIGLDICLHASETLSAALGDRYTPAYLLKRKVEAGDLGKKSGRGFYEYE